MRSLNIDFVLNYRNILLQLAPCRGIQGCVPLGWYGSRSVIRDHSDMVDKMNWWIHSGQGFIGSFDLPWSKWSRITDPDPDHIKGTHPKTVLDSESHSMDSGFRVLDSSLFHWNLNTPIWSNLCKNPLCQTESKGVLKLTKTSVYFITMTMHALVYKSP